MFCVCNVYVYIIKRGMIDTATNRLSRESALVALSFSLISPSFNLQFIILTYINIIPTLNRPANRVGPLLFYNYFFVFFFLWEFYFVQPLRIIFTRYDFYTYVLFLNSSRIIAIGVYKNRFLSFFYFIKKTHP